ncbi:MAG: hypothetical protein IJC15_00345 [Clostridia bacterium]|nr:hypothetical protein [Clostridia bacterium]
MNKTFSALYLALVMAVCLFFSVGAFFFRPDAEAEGRELTPIPPLLTEDGRFNRDFAVGLEPVFAERFALRPQLVTADSILNAGLFSTGTEQVIVGREGYLFFGETLDDYMGTNPMTEEEIAAAADALAAMADYAEARGAQFLFAPAPNKNTVLGDFMPARYLPAEGERDLDRLFAALDARGVAYVDLRSVLSGDRLYHKRDTHWNGEGARVAYAAMMEALGLVHDDFSAAPKRTVYDFPGDLDALLTPSLTRYDENVVYDLPAFTYTSSGTDPMAMILSTACNGAAVRSAMIFRDSFGSALIPYFSAAFAEVRYERANPYRLDQLEKKPADVVIVEIAERNLRDLIGADERVAG